MKKPTSTGQAAAYGVTATYEYEVGYPATINEPEKTAFASDVAREIAGENGVDESALPEMGAEDFAYFLEKRPGAYLFIGNGDTAGLHHPAYDFNDEAIPHGISYWVKLAETALAD